MTLKKTFVGWAIAVVAGVFVFPAERTLAACATLPAPQVAIKINVFAQGDYRVWLKQITPADSQEPLYLQVDDGCPTAIAKNKTVGEFGWVGTNAESVPLTYTLPAGEHTVRVAGTHTTSGIDMGLFTTQTACEPVDTGNNCLVVEKTDQPLKTESTTQAKPVEVIDQNKLDTTILVFMGIGWGMLFVGVLAFVARKYHIFMRTQLQSQPDVKWYRHMLSMHSFGQFVQHHKLVTAISGGLLVALIVLLIIGIRAFASTDQRFEAEAGALTGGAKVFENALASEREYVGFQDITNAPSTPGAQNNTGGGSSGGSNNSGGGGGTSGGGSSQPAGCAVATQHLPDGPDGMGGCWPGPSNTGVPAGVTLSAYSGPCTITVPNTVIDAKEISCQILVRANNLTIKRSHLTGGVSGLESDGASFRIEDSTLENGVCANCSVDGWNSSIVRTEINGSNRGLYCMHVCLLQDSWIHGTALDPDSEWHASAVRAEQYATITHSVLACDWTGPFNNDEIGCSADMSGYPDFAPIHHNTITNNLFRANPVGLGFCAYGGGTLGKPYSNDALNATYIVFTGNVFERGSNGKCGTWGHITDYLTGRAGNQWSNNKWTDGATADSD